MRLAERASTPGGNASIATRRDRQAKPPMGGVKSERRGEELTEGKKERK